MEKEQTDNQEQNQEVSNTEEDTKQKEGSPSEISENVKELSPEDKIAELEDKLARTFAEMENQRRRFEKEKDCLLYTSPSPRDQRGSRMPSSA